MANPALHLLNVKTVERPRQKRYLLMIGALLLFVFLVVLGSILLTRQGMPAISLFVRPNRALALVPSEATFLLDWTPNSAQAQKFSEFCQTLATTRAAAVAQCQSERLLSYLPLPPNSFDFKKIREVAWFSFPGGAEEAKVIIVDYAYGLDHFLARIQKGGARIIGREYGNEIGQFGEADASFYYTHFDNLLVFSQNKDALGRILLLRQGRAQSLVQAAHFRKLRRKLNLLSPLYFYRVSEGGTPSLLILDAIKDERLVLKSYALKAPNTSSEVDPSWRRFIPARPAAFLHVGQNENLEIQEGFWSQIIGFLNFEEWGAKFAQFQLPDMEGLDSLLQGDFEIIVTENQARQKETVLILASTPELDAKIAALRQDLELVAGQIYAREEEVLLPDQTLSIEYYRDLERKAGSEQEVAGIPVFVIDLPGKESRSFLYGALDDKVLVSDSKNAFTQVVTAFRTKDHPREVPLLLDKTENNSQWFYLDLEALPGLGAFTPLQGLRRMQGVSRREAEGEYAEIWVELIGQK